MTTLEELESGMDDACVSILGDSITFRPVSGSALSLKAFVNFEEVARSLGTGQAIEQAMTCEVRKTDVPVRPSDACRITLAKVPGKTFKPVNVSLDRSGTFWFFELQRVNV